MWKIIRIFRILFAVFIHNCWSFAWAKNKFIKIKRTQHLIIYLRLMVTSSNLLLYTSSAHAYAKWNSNPLLKLNWWPLLFHFSKGVDIAICLVLLFSYLDRFLKEISLYSRMVLVANHWYAHCIHWINRLPWESIANIYLSSMIRRDQIRYVIIFCNFNEIFDAKHWFFSSFSLFTFLADHCLF